MSGLNQILRIGIIKYAIKPDKSSVLEFNVIEYWDAIRAKANDNRQWNDLNLHQQQLIINSINQLLFVLHSKNDGK